MIMRNYSASIVKLCRGSADTEAILNSQQMYNKMFVQYSSKVRKLYTQLNSKPLSHQTPKSLVPKRGKS